MAEIAHGHFSRVPVYRETPGNIVGILHAKDLAARRLESTSPRVDRLLRPAYFIPPAKALGDLFDEMRRGRFQMALVVNEYGHLLGLVTLEDLLEELFGELRDEFDSEVPELEKINDHEWLVSGAIEVKKLNLALGANPPIEARGGGPTLSAVLLRKLGRVPPAGEILQLGAFAATRRARARRDRRAGEAHAMTAWELIAAIAACVAVQAFFAASEIAVVSADEVKVRAESERGSARSHALGALLANRDRLLALTLTSNNVATVLAAVMLTAFLHRLYPGYSYWAPFMLAPVTLIFGESIPKLVALGNPLWVARFAAPPLRILATILAPILVAETLLSRAMRRVAGVAPGADSVFLSREDLARLVHRRAPDSAAQDLADQHDAILPSERHMISRIFRFSRADARKAMVPLVRVDAIPHDITLSGAIETVAPRRLQPPAGVPRADYRYRRRGARVRSIAGARSHSPGQRGDAAGQLFSGIDAAG